MKNKKFQSVPEFLSYYGKLPQLGWRAQLAGEKIRLVAPGKTRPSYCPITAVCKELTDEFFHSNFEFQEASSLIFCPNIVYGPILGAADGQCHMNEAKSSLRKSLLKPFGLQDRS